MTRLYRKVQRPVKEQAEIEAIRSALKSKATTGGRVGSRGYNTVLQLITELRARREALGIEQAELAERMGIAASALCRLETFKVVNPSAWTLMQWAEALGFDLEFGLQPQADLKERVA